MEFTVTLQASGKRFAVGADESVLDAARRAGLALPYSCLSGVCVPGYIVPFGSREMPVARGWGSGGLQVTLAIGGPDDSVKVIDQGDEEGVNAVNLRRLIAGTLRCRTRPSRSSRSSC